MELEMSASLSIVPVKSMPDKSMPAIFAPVRSAPLSVAPVKSLPFEIIPARFAPVRSAPLSVVPIRTEFDRSASTSIVFDKLASMMTLFDKSSPAKSMPDLSKFKRFVLSEWVPRKLVIVNASTILPSIFLK